MIAIQFVTKFSYANLINKGSLKKKVKLASPTFSVWRCNCSIRVTLSAIFPVFLLLYHKLTSAHFTLIYLISSTATSRVVIKSDWQGNLFRAPACFHKNIWSWCINNVPHMLYVSIFFPTTRRHVFFRFI